MLSLVLAAIATGEVTHVECGKYSYEEYLPKAFTAEKEWPVLYVLDSRGRGDRLARMIEPIAEERGVVLVASNDTRSDNPGWPNEEAIRATWECAHLRVK